MSGPDRRMRCACGHLLSDHGREAERACSVEGCACPRLRPAPRACCTNCGHPSSFRTSRLADGGLRCAAHGCTCEEWTPQPAEGEPSLTADVVTAEIDGRMYRMTFRRPAIGESARLRITPSGQVQMEFMSGSGT